MKKKFLLLVMFVLILALGFYFYQNIQNKNIVSNKFVYNGQTDRWEQVEDEIDKVAPDRAQILEKDNNVDRIRNQTILKGYFTNYDENTQLLSLKSLLPFTQGLFESVELKIFPSTPLTNLAEVSLPYSLANSTASSTKTFLGVFSV